MKKGNKKSLAAFFRFTLLSIILIVSMAISYLHVIGGSNYPSVHAICPLGGLENLWTWIAGRSNLQKLFTSTMTLFFMTLIFAFVFGRAFCGNICPFGFLQELMGRLTKRKIIIPKRLDRIMRFSKYIVLAIITVMAWITATLWISPYDPWTAFSHIWSGKELFEENMIGFIILIIVLGLSVFIDRFFCKYLCPAGALYGAVSKISGFKIKHEACTQCDICSKVCPMNIEVAKSDNIHSAECIACGKCITACPSKKRTLKMTFWGKAIKPSVFTIIVVSVFFISIAALDQAGVMQVTVPSVEKVQKSGDYLKIADLRGSMSIQEGADYVGMEPAEFYKLMEIPESVSKDTLLKDIQNYVEGYDFHVMKSKK